MVEPSSGDGYHVGLRLDRSLSHGVGDRVRLAHAYTDMAFAVSHYDYRIEPEMAAALDDLGDTGYSDDPLYEGHLLLVFLIPPLREIHSH